MNVKVSSNFPRFSVVGVGAREDFLRKTEERIGERGSLMESRVSSRSEVLREKRD